VNVSLIIFGLLGLALGSFGNVLLYRIASEKSVGGRSFCPHCKKGIRWYDLIPVLSFMLLGGRCRSCKKSISVGYPLIELASCALFVLAAVLFPTDIVVGFLIAIILWSVLLLSVYDIRHQQIPDLFTIVIGASALTLVILGSTSAVNAFLGFAVSMLWFGLLWLCSKGRATGSGDVFLAGALGLWLGLWHSIIMLLLSYIVGALVILVLLIMKIIPRKAHQRIPFGPFLAIGALLALLGVGEWYLSLIG